MILELMLSVGEVGCYSQVIFFSLLAQVKMRYSSRDGKGQQDECCVLEMLIQNTG